MVVRKPTYKTWWLDFQGIETIHINHTSMPLTTLRGLVLPYFVTFWGSKNNGNGCRTNAVKRKVVWVLSWWWLHVATVGGLSGELGCFRWWTKNVLGSPNLSTRWAPDPDFNAVASVVKVLKLQIVLSAGWRKFSIIQNHPYPGGNMFSRDWFQRQGNTHILQIQNECSSSSHLKMCRSSSFLSPPTETLDLRRQSCWDEIEGSVRVTFQGGEKWCGQPGLTLAQRSDGLRCKMGHLPGRIWLKTLL